MFKKVAIVGTGLIGGSIALDIKKKKLAKEVIGVSRHKKSLLQALKSGAIDRGSQDLGIVKDADLVILATPVSAILDLAPKIRKLIKKDCIVSDVGSTKQAIVSKLEKIFPNYIGGHPMAGSEKRGIANAGTGLFKDSLCILTPTEKTDKKTLKKMILFWRRLGARTALLDPALHDRVLSFVSHLPHIVAFSLIASVPQEFLKFAASGLKDTTRIAASESEVWSDIFLSNKNLAEAIDAFSKSLSRIKSAIRKKDRAKLAQILKQAKDKREILG